MSDGAHTAERNGGARRPAHAAGHAEPPAADPASVPVSATQQELSEIVVASLRANCALNLRVRTGLGIFGLLSATLALGYAALNAGEIAAAAGEDSAKASAALLAGALPVVLLVVLSAISGLAAWAVHERGLDELYGTIDAVSRMEREGEVAVSSRGLIHAFEEKLNSTRRAFTLLLWLGRTLFIVCLGLAIAAVVSAMSDGDPWVTGALGGSSAIGAFLGVARRVPQNIAHHLADVIQIQTVVTGSDRQISLLETAAIDAINDTAGRATARDEVLAVQQRMDHVIAGAVGRIERFADPEFRGRR